MGEQFPAQDRYPKKIRTTLDGQEIEVYDTDNLFANLSMVIKMQDRTEGKIPQDAPMNVIEESFATGRRTDKEYFEKFINDPTERNQELVDLARERNQLFDAIYAQEEGAPERWLAWNQEHQLDPKFMQLRSDAFEIMATQAEADGLPPIDLTR